MKYLLILITCSLGLAIQAEEINLSSNVQHVSASDVYNSAKEAAKSSIKAVKDGADTLVTLTKTYGPTIGKSIANYGPALVIALVAGKAAVDQGQKSKDQVLKDFIDAKEKPFPANYEKEKRQTPDEEKLARNAMCNKEEAVCIAKARSDYSAFANAKKIIEDEVNFCTNKWVNCNETGFFKPTKDYVYGSDSHLGHIDMTGIYEGLKK